MDKRFQKLLKEYNWQPWLKRPFYGFLISNFKNGSTKTAFKKIGLPGWECDFCFSGHQWYESPKAYQRANKVVLSWVKKHHTEEITERLERSRFLWVEEVSAYSKQPQKDLIKKLTRLSLILREITTYVWASHAAEHFLFPLLKKSAKKFTKENIEKYIGDLAYPEKLNAAEQMIEEYKDGAKPAVLAKKFGWMRARDGFSRPYTAKEIEAIAKNALKYPAHKRQQVPKPLGDMISQAKELIYLRTFRSDVYYEILFLAKPLLKRAAKKYGIAFARLKYYTLESLIKGNPKRYAPDFTGMSVMGKFYYFDEPIFSNTNIGEQSEVTGIIAQTGFASGEVKILMDVKDMEKVKKGNILVTYMTNPNFLPAMKRAIAFVTNEGGLTCHAAIIAREMKKPCVIGTKIATQVFKDGDKVEVDADKGVVRRIK